MNMMPQVHVNTVECRSYFMTWSVLVLLVLLVCTGLYWSYCTRLTGSYWTWSYWSYLAYTHRRKVEWQLNPVLYNRNFLAV